MFDANEFMKHAIDMHCHCYPDAAGKDHHLMTKTNEDVIKTDRDGGMYGLVLKAHCWPPIRLAHKLNEMYNDFTVYPSVSLNQTSGGPYPWVVEMAHNLGARFIWLPTWSSLNDKNSPAGYYGLTCGEESNRYWKDIPDEAFYTEIDEDGDLKENIKEVVSLCKEYDLVLGTGHGTTKEALAVARFAHEIGFGKLCFTHPYCGLDAVTHDQLKEFADLGGYIELTTLEVQPLYTSMTIAEWIEICELCGYDHCYISSDHYFDWTPTVPEQFKSVIGCMHACGAKDEDIMTMMENPYSLLEG